MTNKSFMPTRRQALFMGAAATFLPSAATAIPALAPSELKAGRDQNFDLNWQFYKGAGEGMETVSFNDSVWRNLDLPHDWSIEDLPTISGPKIIGPFDPKAIGGTATGFTVGGEGWYRKHFRADARLLKGHVEIVFGGIHELADIWLNGQHLTTHYHGYTAIVCDLTPYLVSGDNVLAVHVRNIGKTSRWYAGSGIYRSVTVNVAPQKAHIPQWGVSVMTQAISDAGAELRVVTELNATTNDMTLVTSLRDDKGKVVASQEATAASQLTQQLIVSEPHLWSPNSPRLYTLESELRSGKRRLDRAVTPVGIRIITFDADNGMQINGEPLKMRGGCVHHDNGPIGAVSYADAENRRMRVMKARGYNAIRCSHNPPSREFAEAADRNGILLIVEAFDCWHVGKNPQDYGVYFKDHWQEDLQTMVFTHRNSPSVVMWSIGNEIPFRTSYAGIEYQWRLANELRRIDPTRPATAAINNFTGRLLKPNAATARPGFADVPDEAAVLFLDVAGYNYKTFDYGPDHEKFPKRIMYGSESYPFEMFDIWRELEDKPYVIGDFVWTAMDYLGEAGCGAVNNVKPAMVPMMALVPGSYPWVNAYCGDIDLIGKPKAAARARDVLWGISPVELSVERPVPEGLVAVPTKWGWADELQSWTWPGQEGKTMAVKCYTSGDRIELYLNDVVVASKGLAAADKMQARFDVVYEVGTLRAVAFRSGKEIGRQEYKTLGKATGVHLVPETARTRADRHGLTYVDVQIVDSSGALMPDASDAVTLTVSGGAELIGFTSGNPLAIGSFQSATSKTFHGRAMAVLRSNGKPGTVRITGAAEGLNAGAAVVTLT